jgi:hypothetical protein
MPSFTQIKIYNIDEINLNNLIKKTLIETNDKRFIIYDNKKNADIVLKNAYKNIIPILLEHQYTNIIHNSIMLSNKKNFIEMVLEKSIPKTIIFNKYKSYNYNKKLINDTFINTKIIVKPVAGSLGNGILIFNNNEDFLEHTKKDINLPNIIIIQECIKPYIIKDVNEINCLTNNNNNYYLNKKFDMRIYLFVSNNRNYYISDNSFLRFSALKYNDKIIDNVMLLTNTSINKHYTNNTSNLILSTKDWKPYKNYKPIIEEYCVAFLKKLFDCPFNEFINLKDQKFISILGIDVIITEDKQVKLLEVNRRPNLSFLNKKQKTIKINMCKDYLNFVENELTGNINDISNKIKPF